MKKNILSLFMILVLCMTAFPISTSAAASPGGFTLSDDGTHYIYTLPDTAPAHDYYREAYSTSHEFRDIFITQYGSDKAIVYDMVAHVMIMALYDDSLAYGKEVVIHGFEKIADVNTRSAARLAVNKDMPFLQTFVSFGGGGSEYNYESTLTREVVNYFSDLAPWDNASYIATRDAVMAELDGYRAAAAGISDDEERLEAVGKLFDEGAVYDKSAPYHAVHALLYKRGVCGSSNWAFAMVGNAVGVPSYHLGIPAKNHAVTLVRPNSGELKVIDVTFGIRSPRVSDVSQWKYRDQMTWNSDSLSFKNEYYFPDVNILDRLGGLS